jgi:hypothetical protein
MPWAPFFKLSLISTYAAHEYLKLRVITQAQGLGFKGLGFNWDS